ncbi:MAG: hypothetical protein NE327_05110, partial [Lentisphaeraceae bacterium]|nr:hypothetical protein [Lentisphaeraceae bacterium]
LNEKLSENKIMPILPNISTQNEYSPNKPVDSSFLSKAVHFLNESISASKLHNEKIISDSGSILDGDKNPFYKMASPLVFKVGEFRNDLPFIVNKVAENAIQVKTDTGKLVTIFKNKIILKSLQLIDISKDGAKFKKISDNSVFFMKIGKRFSIDQFIFINAKQKIHKLSHGDNFMGYNVLIENEEAAFSKDGKLYRQKEFYFELPDLDENAGIHKIKNCGCYIAPHETNMLPMSPLEITKAKTQKIDENYIAEFCDIELFKVLDKKTGINTGSIKASKIGIYRKVGESFIPVDLEEGAEDYDISFQKGKLTINGKTPRQYTDFFKKSAFMISLNQNEHVGIRMIPKNPWTLERVISEFRTSITYEGIKYNYDFGDKKVFANGKEVPFNFLINPDKFQLTIDGKTYKLFFKNSNIFLKSEEMKAGFRVYHSAVPVPK